MHVDEYVLPRTEEEYERLRAQAAMWDPQAARLFDRIGLRAGARCLDVGCGPGGTMRLMAQRVGPHGRVTGLDVDASLGAQSVAALHAEGYRQCSFTHADIETAGIVPEAPFDLVFARLLLLHVDDPVVVLRRLWDCVTPGGHLVVQEHDLLSGSVMPELASAEEFKRVAVGTFEAAGSDLQLGPRSRPATRPSTARSCPPRCSSASRHRTAAPSGSRRSAATAPRRTTTPRCGR